jgi:membrane glycosyltransferase
MARRLPARLRRVLAFLGRGGIGLLIVLTAAAGTLSLYDRLSAGGFDWVEAALTGLYALLILWIASAFWFCTAGAIWWLHHKWRHGTSGQLVPQPAAADADAPARTAILMPVYNEPADRVFAAMRATIESVREAGGLPLFDFYILSDSTDPENWVWEERCWLHTARDAGVGDKLFYRRRADNAGRKPGNIAEFCTRWGGHYDYMAVLDADSVMDGPTLIEMVRRMDAAPDTALLQAWPRPVNGRTLFARLQQFSASLVGRLVVAGLGWLSGGASTYWGHNAVIRVDAFTQSCGLPRLPGRPPFGGDILSHDFIEAALLVRAGWKVRIAPDLGGSYEEAPPNMLESLSRDRRWCQGNMQHIRLLFTRGLHWMSRVNLLVGIMSFLSAPLWAVFVGFTILEAAHTSYWESLAIATDLPVEATGPLSLEKLLALASDTQLMSLLALAATLLLGPKLMGYLLLCTDRWLRRTHGGVARLTAGLGLETVLSALAAPVLMVMHARFVVEVLAGRSVKWSAQQRDADRVSWRECVRAHWSQTALGVAVGVTTAVFAPVLFWWLSPVVLGLLLAIPLSYLMGQASAGGRLRALGLLATPEERETPAVLARSADLAADDPGLAKPDIGEVISDPWLNAAHVALIPHPDRPAPRGAELNAALTRARQGGLAALRSGDWRQLLMDAESTRELHLAGVA